MSSSLCWVSLLVICRKLVLAPGRYCLESMIGAEDSFI
ncbi:unnamed protein product [Brassica oleracea]